MSENILTHVKKAIEERRADEIEANGAGGATDWADYKRRIGKIQGLDAALTEIDATKKKLQQNGDLDSDE